jgi:hypothetical protein
MKTPTWLKCLAVPTAVLLAGGFVAYRAGAFDRFWTPAPTPAGEEADGDPAMFYSSKTIRIQPRSGQPAVGEAPVTVISGTKYLSPPDVKSKEPPSSEPKQP